MRFRVHSGVGLSVCKNLSDLMGFDIYLDDSYDSGLEGCPGTRFVVRLNQPALTVEGSFRASQTSVAEKAPLLNGTMTDSTTTPPAPEKAPEGLPETLSVLFVDDDTVLRRMFTRALKRACPGWQICEASNGETALRLTETQKFDIIFMDQYVSARNLFTSVVDFATGWKTLDHQQWSSRLTLFPNRAQRRFFPWPC